MAEMRSASEMVEIVTVPKTSSDCGTSAAHVMRVESSSLHKSSGPTGSETSNRKPLSSSRSRAIRSMAVGA